MNFFILNLLLAFAWAGLVGSVSQGSLLSGYILGYAILWVFFRKKDEKHYIGKTPRLFRFLLFYIKEIFIANLKVAYDILTPTHYMRPGVIAVELDAHTDIEITLLANLITMTPGTLSIDVSTDRKVLYVHAMYIKDVDTVKREVKEMLEKRVLDILR